MVFRDKSNDDTFKALSSLLRCRFWFLARFYLRGFTWATLCNGPKPTLTKVGTCPFSSTHISKSNFPEYKMLHDNKSYTKNFFFRSGQYLAGTGPEPDLEKMTGSTGTGTETVFPVALCN